MTKHDDVEFMQELLSAAQVGWWKADWNTCAYECSDYLKELLGMEKECILSFADYQNLIHEEYRDFILRDVGPTVHLNQLDQIYPIRNFAGEEMWVRSRVLRIDKKEDGNYLLSGMTQKVENPDIELLVGEVRRIKEQVALQKSMSDSLTGFLHNNNPLQGVNYILNELLRVFKGQRAYVFEYDETYHYQTCIYETTTGDTQPEKENWQQLPIEMCHQMNMKLMEGSTYSVNSTSDPAPGLEADCEILRAYGVKAILTVPLKLNGRVWGYAGVNLTKLNKIWSAGDAIWMESVGNMFSVCLQLINTREAAMRERAFVSELYRYMPLGYVRLNMIYDEFGSVVDFEVVDYNDLYGTLSGRKIDMFLNKRIGEIEPDILPKIGCILEDLGQDDNYKDVHVHMEASGLDCRCVAFSPKPGEVVVLVLDTTEIERARQALDSSERLFQNIFANIPVGVEIYDKDGYLIDLNTHDMEMFGIQREDILGHNIFDNPHVSDETKDKLRAYETVDVQLDYRFDTASRFCPTDMSGALNLTTKVRNLYTRNGEFNGWIMLNIDHTEQRHATKQIQEFENMFQIVSDYAKVGYAKLNFMAREGYAVKQWYKNMGEEEGTPLSEVVGVYSKIHPEDRVEFLDFYNQALTGRVNSFRKEVRVLQPGTTDKWNWVRVHVVVTELDTNHNVMEIIGINFDITELKEIQAKLIESKEQAEEADRLKSAFLANMSHEIRTPLNAIVGFSSMLVEAEEMDERLEYIRIVEENNGLLLQLISDILDLSKIEAGTFDFTSGPINVNEMCEDIVRALQIKVPDSVRLYFEVGQADCRIVSDRNRLHQVISNFVNNSVKFTSEGFIRVTYQVDGHRIKFSVTDTGIGIAADKAPQVFERFVKLNSFVNGTGLGLPICKSIVEQLGGTIGVDTELGKGSCFWFTIPVVWDKD